MKKSKGRNEWRNRRRRERRHTPEGEQILHLRRLVLGTRFHRVLSLGTRFHRGDQVAGHASEVEGQIREAA
jgi:hypothetical protein